MNALTIYFATSANMTAGSGNHITVHGLSGNQMGDSQKLLVAGGFTSRLQLNDAWVSNENGSHWMLLNSSHQWCTREGHMLVYHPGGSALSADSSSSAIFLIGGFSTAKGPVGPYLSDVWRSDDNGKHWIEIFNSSSTFSPRAWFGAAVVDGRIYVGGGVTFSQIPLSDFYYSGLIVEFFIRALQVFTTSFFTRISFCSLAHKHLVTL
jgi:hypothetical protein